MSSTPLDFQKKFFDVFLCHNNKDKGEVREIAKLLQAQGVVPWLDEWELQPGLPWQRALEQQIGTIKSAAVFVGTSGFGPWQNMELDAFLREFVSRGCPVIPVLLKTAPDKPQLPPFLASMTWVDFHKQEPDPIQRLLWGITGKKPDANDSRSTDDQSSLAQAVPGRSLDDPIEVFISYAEDDEKFKKQLENHLAMLRREKNISPWHSQQIRIGQEREQTIAGHINSAQIILLLISPSFLASDDLYEKEMTRAMERHESGDARVVPIILRSVDLGKTPFKKLQFLPRNGNPVDAGRNADETWRDIALEIRGLCETMRGKQEKR